MSSPLLDKIMEEIKQTMKSQDKERLITLRTLHSEIKNVGINKRKEITDEDVLSVIAKGIKLRTDAIEQFKQGGREDLVQKEQAQIDLYKTFQPEQMAPSEIEKIVDRIINETGVTSKKDIGLVMKNLMPLVKGKADGRIVNQIVNKKLPE